MLEVEIDLHHTVTYTLREGEYFDPSRNGRDSAEPGKSAGRPAGQHEVRYHLSLQVAKVGNDGQEKCVDFESRITSAIASLRACPGDHHLCCGGPLLPRRWNGKSVGIAPAFLTRVDYFLRGVPRCAIVRPTKTVQNHDRHAKRELAASINADPSPN
jgi:hypothetical protein